MSIWQLSNSIKYKYIPRSENKLFGFVVGTSVWLDFAPMFSHPPINPSELLSFPNGSNKKSLFCALKSVCDVFLLKLLKLPFIGSPIRFGVTPDVNSPKLLSELVSNPPNRSKLLLCVLLGVDILAGGVELRLSKSTASSIGLSGVALWKKPR